MINTSFNETITSWNTTTSWQYNPGALRGQLTPWFIVLITFSLFGVVSNALLIRIIANHKKLRNGCGSLILHLLITSLIMCGIHFPINAVVLYGKAYWFMAVPANICSYIHSLQSATVYASNWTEAWLAINRLVAIIFPYRYSKWVAPWSFRAMVTFCWGMGIATVLPFALGFRGSFIMSGVGHCAMVPELNNLASYCFLGLSAYGPYIVVGGVLVVIVGHPLTYRTTQVSVSMNNSMVFERQRLVQMKKRRLRVARMLLVSFLFCVACNLPTYALLTMDSGTVLQRQPLLLVWMRLCLVSQYAFSPVIFICLNQDYRFELRRILQRQGWRLNHRPDRVEDVACINMANSSQNVITQNSNLSAPWRFNSEILHVQQTAWFVLLITLNLFEVVSDALLIRIIANRKKLRNSSGSLILHLLITSLIMCGIHFPINAVVVYGKAYWFVAVPSNICTYIHSIQTAAIYASNWTEVWLAINRLVAIIFPYRYSKWIAPWPFRAMVTFCWGMGIATALPFALALGGSFQLPGWFIVE